ncbi:hypothetical protein LEMLEM_LOCUS15113 [Lemmus lemmus]
MHPATQASAEPGEDTVGYGRRSSILGEGRAPGRPLPPCFLPCTLDLSLGPRAHGTTSSADNGDDGGGGAVEEAWPA